MKRYEIAPGTPVDLRRWDPRDVSATPETKAQGKRELRRTSQHLEALQEHLFAEHARALLVVLQGMDTAGKDGVIRHVFEAANPQGVRVASFKQPSSTELDHDYLWRIHRQAPARGFITIFNRSHYEDVLVVRVHRTISGEECEQRYRQINDFERMLVEEGTAILKFFLHVSKDEQKQRLTERLAKRRKHWKFSFGDLRERALWDDYAAAYTELLERTSTRVAPWYVVPADRKWYRNLIVAKIIVATLERVRGSASGA